MSTHFYKHREIRNDDNWMRGLATSAMYDFFADS